MKPFPFLFNGPDDAACTLILAHGAGLPMDSEFMNVFAEGIAESGIRVARFEFDYMIARRRDGRKRPPDPPRLLIETWQTAIETLGGGECVAIGGKSMGGRVASLVADSCTVRRLVCLGYPFHPPGRTDSKRTEHLETLETPALIVQGTRDSFGSQQEVATYRLAEQIKVHWLEDGDHDFRPRKKSGLTHAQNWESGIRAVTSFLLEDSPS